MQRDKRLCTVLWTPLTLGRNRVAVEDKRSTDGREPGLADGLGHCANRSACFKAFSLARRVRRPRPTKECAVLRPKGRVGRPRPTVRTDRPASRRFHQHDASGGHALPKNAPCCVQRVGSDGLGRPCEQIGLFQGVFISAARPAKPPKACRWFGHERSEVGRRPEPGMRAG